MASTINATSTDLGGLVTSGDDSGVLNIQTNETTAVTIDASQVVTFVNAPVMGVTGLTGDIAAARVTSALNASGSAPIYACRAWVNFNGTGTVAIRASGNVSSITDNGVGVYTVNFTTAMPDANYSPLALVNGVYNGSAVQLSDASGNDTATPNITTSAVTVCVRGNGSPSVATADAAYVCLSIFR